MFPLFRHMNPIPPLIVFFFNLLMTNKKLECTDAHRYPKINCYIEGSQALLNRPSDYRSFNMNERVGRVGSVILTGVNPRYAEKTLSQCHFVPHRYRL